MAKAVSEIHPQEKLFYKIGEVCELTDTQPYVLRFWESEFPQLAPQKNRSGQRIYRRNDIELILNIKRLLYEQEFTIAGARRQLETEKDQVAAVPLPERTGAGLKIFLQEFRSELKNLLKMLDRPIPRAPSEKK